MKASTIFVSFLLGLSAFGFLYVVYPSVPATRLIVTVEYSTYVSTTLSTMPAWSYGSPYPFSSQTTTTTTNSQGPKCDCVTTITDTVCSYDPVGRCSPLTVGICGWGNCVSGNWGVTSTSMYTYITYPSSPYTFTFSGGTSTFAPVKVTNTRLAAQAIPLYESLGMKTVQIVALFAILVALILLGFREAQKRDLPGTVRQWTSRAPAMSRLLI